MALLEEGLVAYLKAQSPTIAGDRIYPFPLPQNWASPAITFQRISGVRERGLDGPHGRARPRIQIDVWAKQDYASAKNLAEELRQLLDGFAGTMGTVTVDAVSLESDRDLYEDQARINRVSMDFLISYREP